MAGKKKTDMTTRECFNKIMRGEPTPWVPNYELGCWGQTIDRWWREGMPVTKSLVGTMDMFEGEPLFHLDRRQFARLNTGMVPDLRPIDLRFGPDGALYIADWSNPIIQHGEVDFRDPRRDKEHGRIWRVTAKGAAPVKRQLTLTALDTVSLLHRTLSKSGWEQEQARVVLRQRGADKVLPQVKPWLAKQTDSRAKLEAMWIHEAFEKQADGLLGELVAAKDERIRTAAARQLSR